MHTRQYKPDNIYWTQSIEQNKLDKIHCTKYIRQNIPDKKYQNLNFFNLIDGRILYNDLLNSRF